MSRTQLVLLAALSLACSAMAQTPAPASGNQQGRAIHAKIASRRMFFESARNVSILELARR